MKPSVLSAAATNPIVSVTYYKSMQKHCVNNVFCPHTEGANERVLISDSTGMKSMKTRREQEGGGGARWHARSYHPHHHHHQHLHPP